LPKSAVEVFVWGFYMYFWIKYDKIGIEIGKVEEKNE